MLNKLVHIKPINLLLSFSLWRTRRVVTMNDERAAVINDAPSIIPPCRCCPPLPLPPAARHYFHPGRPVAASRYYGGTRLIDAFNIFNILLMLVRVRFCGDVLIEMWGFDWSYYVSVSIISK